MKPGEGTLLGVFGKYWQPGTVKTRLASSIGPAAAAALHRIFLETTLQRLTGLADQGVICYWPPEREREFEQVRPQGWSLACQSAGNLGRRMEDFFNRALAAGFGKVVLVGSDAPTLPTAHVTQAFKYLDRTEVVLGPTSDGGYYLVGAKHCTPPIFRNITWSTAHVWRETLDSLHAAGLRERSHYAVLPSWFDVDTLADLQKLRSTLPAGTEGNSPLNRLARAIHSPTLIRSASTEA